VRLTDAERMVYAAAFAIAVSEDYKPEWCAQRAAAAVNVLRGPPDTEMQPMLREFRGGEPLPPLRPMLKDVY
jgi:hypothetical protein